MPEARRRVNGRESSAGRPESASPTHARAEDTAVDIPVTAGHDQPAPSTGATAFWPLATRHVRRHGTLIRLTGSFTDDDVSAVRATLPARHITLETNIITVWPIGTRRVTTHHNGLAILVGFFDEADLASLRLAHPDQHVSHDGDTVTIWPTTVEPNRLSL